MRKIGAFILVFSLCLSLQANAQSQSPDALREQAFADIKTASSLMESAVRAMRNSNDQGDLKLALQLFAEAGKLFQQAAGKLQVLVPEYASEKDLEGCVKAMDACMDAINKIKKRLSQL